MSGQELTVAARARWAAFESAVEALRDEPAPRMAVTEEVDEDGWKTWSLRCPYCQQDRSVEHLQAVDLSIRHTDFEDIAYDELGLVIRYDDREDYHGLAYWVQCCDAPVDLPEHYTEETL